MDVDDDGPPERHPLPLYGPLIPNEVLGPCPTWCDGIHAPAEEWGVGQYHSAAPVELEVATTTGMLALRAMAEITQYPRAEDPAKRQIYVSMAWEDGCQEYEPEDIANVADALAVYAEQLRALAVRVVELRAADEVQQAR
ncbi:DUF6907 domain-containing protein [Streptacidiphilus carbonis]|uniref:DUF6907 domain-containing protein n=1 Tax=Streptacidiphilus carbonis TaxID=105422 RepID=UPI0005A8E28D|nr:hypothetical protein [Streptacidiphilus carbonis]